MTVEHRRSARPPRACSASCPQSLRRCRCQCLWLLLRRHVEGGNSISRCQRAALGEIKLSAETNKDGQRLRCATAAARSGYQKPEECGSPNVNTSQGYCLSGLNMCIYIWNIHVPIKLSYEERRTEISSWPCVDTWEQILWGRSSPGDPRCQISHIADNGLCLSWCLCCPASSGQKPGWQTATAPLVMFICSFDKCLIEVAVLLNGHANCKMAYSNV